MTNGKASTPSEGCPKCAFDPFIRNHYFTGKLMTARDFTDETRYHSEKMRHHNARLHGWGVVCGLKVTAHENPACRDRFVVIEPGTAIDCCGNEILATEAAVVELEKLPAIAELIQKKDADPHRLQLCIQYKECPTEEVPVLYDECGCDDARCAPNRILSSFEVDAIITDGKADGAEIRAPKLEWIASVNPPHATRVAIHDATGKLYAISASQKTVYQLDANTSMVLGTATLSSAPQALAVSNKGDYLYVATEPAGKSGLAAHLFVLDTANLAGKSLAKLDFTEAGRGDVYLAVTPGSDSRLIALLGTSGKVLIWKDPEKSDAPPKTVTLKDTQDLKSLVLSTDGKFAYSVDAKQNTLVILDIKKEKQAGDPIDLPVRSEPSGLALVASTAEDLLAVYSKSDKSIYLFHPKEKQIIGKPAALEYAPVAAAVSPGGKSGYVLESDGKKSYIQPVNIFGIQKKNTDVAGNVFAVGDDSQDVSISSDGVHLYIPHTGDLSKVGSGGIGKVKVSEEDCAGILWDGLDGCAGCASPNCVVLATVENYNAGYKIEDQTDPPADPLADEAAKTARIDNQTGRRLLPSTSVVAEMVKCLLEQGCGGGASTQGPPGERGPKGDTGATGATGVAGGVGPQGPVGMPGIGLEKDLTRINMISWVHGRHNNLVQVIKKAGDNETPLGKGIVIGFTNKVRVYDPDHPAEKELEIDDQHVFQVFHVVRDPSQGMIKRIQLAGTIYPVKLNINADGLITSAEVVDGPEAYGIAFIIPQGEYWRTMINTDFNLLVRLQGDFVIDVNAKAIDAEFTRAQLQTGDRPKDVEVGIQGGVFESWFRVDQNAN